MSTTSPDTINFYRQGDLYGEFSNFYPAPIFLDDLKWPTTEHYFQAMKFHEHREIMESIRLIGGPGKAASRGRSRALPLRPDWESVKDDIMYRALIAKFTQHKSLQEVLLGTGDATLVEHTTNDSYWADGGDGSGKNMLGILLMRLRGELRSGLHQ
ncbi:hypothetical protein HK104_003339 [Borealophlyctis nickersoniae]|nr:hypothetical protein HK104_003339 [Borealophlyctis nickersoniae]